MSDPARTLTDADVQAIAKQLAAELRRPKQVAPSPRAANADRIAAAREKGSTRARRLGVRLPR